jgi:phenylacetate-CoA ligase
MNLKVAANGLFSMLARRYAGPFWIRRRQLARTQWLAPKALSELQLGLLRRLLKHCYATVPYYRSRMDNVGIKADDIRQLDDVKALPILTRQQILDAGGEMVSSRYPRWLRRTAYTGGTTGTPLALERDIFSIGNEHAFVRRQYDWAGIGMTTRCAFLTGRLVAKPDQTDHLYAYDPFMKELILSTYHLSQRTARQYAQVMKEYNVKALAGYPSAVHVLAQACKDEGPKLSLSAVLTSSEVLTDSMRKTIEDAFGCRVFDFYGSAERVCYIHTCEGGSYHVVPEYGLTELIPIDEREPTRCRIVSTGFWSLAMPLVRYDLSDVVVRADRQCSCGRAFPVIERIVGRQGDSVVTASGRRFGAAILTHLLYGTGNIVESQIIQDALDHIRIEYVPTPQFSNENMRAFDELIRMHLPSELRVEFKRVDAVRRTESGKIRPVVSEVGAPSNS